jgi:hypothetical protein
MSGVQRELLSMGHAVEEVCRASEQRAQANERECNCGCELRATVQCAWCGEFYAEGCAAGGYCFEELRPVCDSCLRDHTAECEGCAERAAEDRAESRGEALRTMAEAEASAVARGAL